MSKIDRICSSDGLPCMFTKNAGTNLYQCVRCWVTETPINATQPTDKSRLTLDTIIYKISNWGKNGYVSSPKSPELSPEEAKQAILEWALSKLPEKKKDTTAQDLRDGTYRRGDDRYTDGYNAATKDMENRLRGGSE